MISFLTKIKRLACAIVLSVILNNLKIELYVKTSITDNHLFQSIEETDHIVQNNEVKKPTKQQQFCGDCGLFFHSKSGYKRHIEIIHAGNKPYKCSYCSLKFYEKRDLKLHFFRKHSAGNFACDMFMCKPNIFLIALKLKVA